MARLSRVETMRRLRIMARNWVAMENGVYEWPDRKPHLDTAGTPQIVKAELLRSADYKITYREGGRQLFEDPYFIKQRDLERTRYQRAFLSASYRSECSMLSLGGLMLQELWDRLVNDPSSFSTKDLAMHGPQIYRMGLEVEAKQRATQAALEGDPKLKIVAQNVMALKPEERQEMLEAQQRAEAQRSETLRRLVTAANSLDEERIVDGPPVEPEPTNGNGAAPRSAEAP